jgi:hypothetical protein
MALLFALSPISQPMSYSRPPSSPSAVEVPRAALLALWLIVVRGPDFGFSPLPLLAPTPLLLPPFAGPHRYYFWGGVYLVNVPSATALFFPWWESFVHHTSHQDYQVVAFARGGGSFTSPFIAE